MSAVAAAVKLPSAIALLLTATLSAAVGAQTPRGMSLEQRVERLERVLENQSRSDILLQLQRLQQEVRLLRGELELQGHALEALQRRRDPFGGAGPAEEQAGPVSDDLWNAPPEPTDLPEVTESVVAPPPTGADSTQEETQYQEAFGLLSERRYEESVAAFQRFLASYPSGGNADLAQYWLAEAHYVIRDFEAALAEFTKLLDSYPQSAKVPSAMLKLGYTHYEMQQWRQARDQLRRLEEQYPRSTEARLAERRLEQMRREGH